MLLPTNANLGRIMRKMEMNVLITGAIVCSKYSNIRYQHLIMFKTLFGVTKMILKSGNHVSTASRNFLYFTLSSNNEKE